MAEMTAGERPAIYLEIEVTSANLDAVFGVVLDPKTDLIKAFKPAADELRGAKHLLGSPLLVLESVNRVVTVDWLTEVRRL